MSTNAKALRKTLEALKASNALSAVTPSLSYAELAQKIAKRAVKNWSTQTMDSQRRRFPSDAVVFTKIEPKHFNLAELAQFVRRDAQVHRTRFRFFSEDVGVDGVTISPLLRRLMNNGAYYQVFGNTPERTAIHLQNSGLLPVPVQVTLVETRSGDHEPSYREVATPPKDILVQIEIDKTRYALSTPSLSLLTRMKGVGIPENHPEHSKLVGVSVPHPLKPSVFIVFHSIPPTEDKTLIALIPGHVQDHRRFFSRLEPIEKPGPIAYEDGSYTLAELDEIIAQRLHISAPMINTAPFMCTKHYDDDGEAMTKILNGEEILDSSKFYHLQTRQKTAKTRSMKTVQITTRTKEFPLSYINNGEIYDILKFTAKSRMFSGVGSITADMLRGVILDSDVISGDLLNEKKLVLEVLNQCMHWYEQSGFVERVQWTPSLKKLLEEDASEDVDKALVKSLYAFAKDPNELNNFVIQFSNYIILLDSQEIYEKGLTPQRRSHITTLLTNVLTRALQDPIRRLFPEFANFWVEEFKFNNLRRVSLAKNDTTNDWKHYIEYLVESNVKVPQETQHLLDITGVLYGYPLMGAPYNSQFEISGIKSDKDKEFLKFVGEQLQTQVVFVDTVGQDTQNRAYLKPVYDSYGSMILPFRTIPDLTTLNDESSKWCQAFAGLDIGEDWNRKALNEIKNQVRHNLKYNEHPSKGEELNGLYTFLNEWFLESSEQFNKVMKLFEEQNKNRVMKPPTESFKTVRPEHIEKRINEFI